MKKITCILFTCAVVLLGLSGCVTDLDLRTMEDDAHLNPSLVLPLGTVNATVLDVCKHSNSDVFDYDEEHNICFLHYIDTIHLNTDSVLNDEFVDVPKRTLVLNRHTLPGAFPSLPYSIPNGTSHVINHRYKYDFEYDKIEGGVQVQRVDSLFMRSVKFHCVIDVAGFTGLAAHPAQVMINFSNIPKLAHINLVRTINSNRITIDTTFTNIMVDMSANSDTSYANINFRHIVNGPLTVQSNYELTYSVQFQDIDYEKAWGFFNRRDEITGDDINTEFPKSYFDSPTLRENRLLCHNPTIDIVTESNIGIPLILRVNYIKAIGVDSNEVQADFNGSASYDVRIPKAQPGQFVRTHDTFDRDNGHTNLLYTINPKRVIYKFGVHVDNAAVNAGGDNARHFLYRPAQTNMYVDTKVPFDFDPTSQYVYCDTLKLDTTLRGAIKLPDELELTQVHLNLDYHNALPVQGVATAICLDSNDVEIYRKENFTIQSPAVDANGYVVTPWHGVETLWFENNEIEKIMQMKKLVLRVTVKGHDDASFINIRLSDYLNIQASLFCKTSYKISKK